MDLKPSHSLSHTESTPHAPSPSGARHAGRRGRGQWWVCASQLMRVSAASINSIHRGLTAVERSIPILILAPHGPRCVTSTTQS
uniref:Uncharacterized protein n=1 Tax=Knipowitschia caucasica TaxID=637954 RepID=A0AAV2MRF2_KNICA